MEFHDFSRFVKYVHFSILLLFFFFCFTGVELYGLVLAKFLALYYISKISKSGVIHLSSTFKVGYIQNTTILALVMLYSF